MRRIFVTGGSGFIGTNLVEHYRASGSTVVLSYDVHPPRSNSHTEHWVEGDLLDAERLTGVMKHFQPTEVVHLGARTDLDGRSMTDYRGNTEGVKVVLDAVAAADSVHRTIYTSSRLVCDTGVTPINEYDYFPPNFYGRSKVIGEQLVRTYPHSSEWVIVRPTSIWGPWGAAPYRDFFLSLQRGRYVHPGRSRARKHYGYVGNTVIQMDRLLLAAADRVCGRTFYLADPEPVNVLQFATAVRKAMGLPPPHSVPRPALRILALMGDALTASGLGRAPLSSPRLAHLTMDMLFDLGDLEEIVGPLPFTMEEGVERTVQHLRRQGDIP